MSRSMLKGIHRRHLGVTPRGMVQAPQGFSAGGDGTPTVDFPSHDVCALFDDFLGDLLADEWAVVTGDTGTASTRALVTGTNGVFRIQNEVTPLAAPGENHAITQGLFKNWKPNASPNGRDGNLRMVARVKIEAASTVKRQNVFIGFSDSGGAEMPAYDTGGGVISNAADLVGFLLGPNGSQGLKWQLVSAKSTAGDSGDQLVVSTVSAQSNIWQTFEIDWRANPSDTGGRATFYINGKAVGSIDSPVGSAVALTPWVGFWQQDTGQRFLDIDYIGISGLRDTGL